MYNIYHDVDIYSPPENIFKMLVTTNGLNSWWTNKSKIDLRIGGKINLYFSDEYDWKAEILKLEDNKFFSYKIIAADSDWTNTELSFEIVRKNENNCLLRFEHKNWKNINDHYRRTNYCWALYFKKMKDSLEQN